MDDTEAAIRKSVVTQSLIDAMNERLVEYGFDDFTKWDFIVHHCAIEADHLIAEAVAAAVDAERARWMRVVVAWTAAKASWERPDNDELMALVEQELWDSLDALRVAASTTPTDPERAT